MQPTKANQERRASQVHKDIEERKLRRKSRSTSKSKSKSRSRGAFLNGIIREESSSSQSTNSGRSQLVDLMVEDNVAEETERVRARKEGGSAWNEGNSKQFV